ncbi:MAG: PAS domain S-box protein [Anaerolineae bacterium]|nr:PAS domain S-box protein [Anaerolineae bacterium]
MGKSPIKLLYVDSRCDDRKQVKNFLTGKNDHAYVIHEATTYKELIDALKNDSYQVLLADLSFPGFNHLDIVTFLKRERPNLPLIILCDAPGDQLQHEALRVGASYVINKACLENLTVFIEESLNQESLQNAAKHLPTVNVPVTGDSLAQMATQPHLVGHWEWIITEQRLIWSSDMFKIYGVKPPANLQAYAAAVHPEDRSCFSDGPDVHIQKAQPGIRGFRIIRPNGEVRFIHEESKLINDGEGRPAKLIGTTLDISYQKELENSLKHTTLLFCDTFEHAGYGVVYFAADGRIKSFNRVYGEMLGYPQDELQGRLAFDFVHPDDRCLNRQVLSQLISNQRSSGEVYNRYLHKDGSVLFCHTTFSRSQETFIGMLRDLTSSRHIELALHESENKFNLLFAHSADAMFLLDESFVLDCNEAALRLLKFTHKSQLIGHSLLEFSPDFQPDGERSYVKNNRMMKEAGEKESVSYEWLCHKNDAEEIYAEVSMTVTPVQGKKVYFAIWRDMTGRRRAEERLQRQLQRLASLRSIDTSISNSQDMNKTLKLVLEITLGELHIDAGAILLLNEKTNHLDYAASLGFINEEAIASTHLERGKGYPWQALLDGRLVVINDLRNAPNSLRALSMENFVAYYCAPLIAKGEMRGAMELFNRTAIHPDQEWLDFMETLAGQATIALDNGFLYNHLRRLNDDLLNAYDITIEGWARALEMRDLETEGHSRRVTNLTINLARKMGIEERNIEHIRRGALLHDIGKMGIPDHVLFKPGPLDDNEWEIMRRHPTYAYDMLSGIKFLSPALDIPYFHQERWNGTGYPLGLKGEDIPLPARIFAVVDVWDALTSTRPYRDKWSRRQTMSYLRDNSDVLFDPDVVESFIDLMQED